MEKKQLWISHEIPEEKLQSIRIDKNGQDVCYKGLIVINGLEFGQDAENKELGNGIAGFDITILASKKPKVTVHYRPEWISEEVAESFGLEKLPPYHKGRQ